MDSDTIINKLRIALSNKPKGSFFSWSQKIQDGLNINEIFLQKDLLQLPLSLQKFGTKLRSTYNSILSSQRKSNLKYSKQPCVFDSKYIGVKYDNQNGFDNPLEQLKYQALQGLFGVSLENVIVNVEVVLEKLVICHLGEHFSDTFTGQKRSGAFGCMMIAIPVENSEGGRVTIKNIDETVTYNFQSSGESNKLHAICMAAKRSTKGAQMYMVEPINEKSMVAFLVFNLVWTDAPVRDDGIHADEFPAFIQAVHHANQALDVWRNPIPNHKKYNCIEENDSDEENNDEDSEILPLELLCVALKNSYNITSFDHSRLVGEDSFTYRVLRALDHINVNLAAVIFNDHDRKYFRCCCCNDAVADEIKRREKNGESLKRNLLTFEYWHFGSKTKLASNLKGRQRLDVSNQLLGDLKAMLFRDDNVALTSDPATSNDGFQDCADIHRHRSNCNCKGRGQIFDESDCKSFHPGLIIEPKWYKANTESVTFRSVSRDLTSRFAEAVEQMEKGNLTVRNVMLSDIRRLLENLRQAKCNFSFKECLECYNMVTLFNYCIHLNAVEEGLQVLNIITDYTCACGMHDWIDQYAEQKNDNDAFASDVTDFVCRLSGWDAFSTIVFRMIKNWGFCRFFHQLSSKLLERDWFEEASLIVEAAIDHLSSLTNDSLNECQAKSIGELALGLNSMTNPEIIDVRNKYDVLLDIFRKLPLTRLFFEIEAFLNHLDNKNQNIPFKLLKDLHTNVLEINVQDISISDFFLLIELYLKSGIEKSFHHLWSQALEDISNNSTKLKNRQCREDNAPFLIRAVLAIQTKDERDVILESLSNFESADRILNVLTETFPFKLEHLRNCFERQHVNESFEFYGLARFTEENDEQMLNLERDVSDLSKLFLFMSSAENFPGLSDKARTEYFCSKITGLDLKTLWRLAISVCSEKAGHLKSTETYRNLFDRILTFDTNELIRSANVKFKEVFLAFLWLQNGEILEKFLKTISLSLRSAATGNLNAEWLYAVLSLSVSILDTPGIYEELDELKLMKSNKDTIDSLMESWVTTALAYAKLGSPNDYCAHAMIEALTFRFLMAFANSEKYVDDERERPLMNLFVNFVKSLNDHTVCKFIARIAAAEIDGRSPGFLKLKNCSILVRKVAQDVVTRDSFFGKRSQQINPMLFVNVIKSFFWLGDEEILNILCRKLRLDPTFQKSYYTQAVRSLVFSAVKSKTVQVLARETPCGIKCYETLMANLVTQTKEAMEPILTWGYCSDLPYSSGNNSLDMFVTLNQESQTFGRFVARKAAENYAKHLKQRLKPSWNIRHEVVRLRPGVFTCKLIKTEKRRIEPENTNVLEMELKGLSKIRQDFEKFGNETLAVMADRKRKYFSLEESARKSKKLCYSDPNITHSVSVSLKDSPVISPASRSDGARDYRNADVDSDYMDDFDESEAVDYNNPYEEVYDPSGCTLS